MSVELRPITVAPEPSWLRDVKELKKPKKVNLSDSSSWKCVIVLHLSAQHLTI